MAKINILFNETNYNVNEESLSSYASLIKSHITNNMSGSGATIDFDGVSYNIDSAKLSTFKNDFISYLGTISGNGSKVSVNGVQYNIDSTKLANAISELDVVFGNLNSEDEGSDLGELNEYGFYYDTKYSKYSPTEGITTLYFRENQTGEVYINDELYLTVPLVYGEKNIVTVPNYGDITFYSEGKMLTSSFLGTFKLGDCIVQENDYIYIFQNLEGYWGWKASVVDKERSIYGALRGEIDGHPVFLSSTFMDCTNLITAPDIPFGVTHMGNTFWNCENLTGTIVINANPTIYGGCFQGTEKPITIIGSCTTETKAILAATAKKGNVSYQ
jgi:hypothetical protein